MGTQAKSHPSIAYAISSTSIHHPALNKKLHQLHKSKKMA